MLYYFLESREAPHVLTEEAKKKVAEFFSKGPNPYGSRLPIYTDEIVIFFLSPKNWPVDIKYFALTGWARKVSGVRFIEWREYELKAPLSQEGRDWSLGTKIPITEETYSVVNNKEIFLKPLPFLIVEEEKD